MLDYGFVLEETMGRSGEITFKLADIFQYFANYWDSVVLGNIVDNTVSQLCHIEKIRDILRIHRWDINELDYIVSKIGDLDSHYDPTPFYGEKELFYVEHVKSSYLLGIWTTDIFF